MPYKDPEKARAAKQKSLKKWRAANPEAYRERTRRSNAKNADKSRQKHARKFGYAPPPEKECPPKPARCNICDTAPDRRSLCLDHCHNTGRFRGWVCDVCNFALGGIDRAGVDKFVRYLAK